MPKSSNLAYVDTTSSRSSDGSDSREHSPVLAGADNRPASPRVIALPASRSREGSPTKYQGFSPEQSSPLLEGQNPESDSDLSRLELARRSSDFSNKSEAGISDASLLFSGRVRKNVVTAYFAFIESKFAVFPHALIVSIPVSLFLSCAVDFSVANLIGAPIYEKGSEKEQHMYLFWNCLSLLAFSLALMGYDVWHRLTSDVNKYSSFGILRLGTAAMSASFGGVLTRTALDFLKSEKLIANFSLTFFITALTGYLRFFHYSQDDFSYASGGTVVGEVSNPQQRGVFKDARIKLLFSALSAVSTGLLVCRSITDGVMNKDYHPWTTFKICSAVVPGCVGVAARVFSSPVFDTHLWWKRTEIVTANAALIHLAISGCVFAFSGYKYPEQAWLKAGTFGALVFALICSTAMAKNLQRRGTEDGSLSAFFTSPGPRVYF